MLSHAKDIAEEEVAKRRGTTALLQVFCCYLVMFLTSLLSRIWTKEEVTMLLHLGIQARPLILAQYIFHF